LTGAAGLATRKTPNMKRTLAFAASALIGAVAGLTNVGPANVAAAGTSACAQLGGNIQAGNICRLYVETPAYILMLRFGTDYPDDKPVLQYVTQQRDEVVNTAQAPGAQYLPYTLEINYTAYHSGQPTRTIPDYGKPWHGTESLVLDTFKSMNTPGNSYYKSFNFDYEQNRPITFDNLFAPGTNPMDSIYPAMADELETQFRDRGFKLTPAAGRNPAHYQNFAITDDSVIWFFNSSELLAQEAGYFFAPIARSKLPPLQI
jgi:hypothetical protein